MANPNSREGSDNSSVIEFHFPESCSFCKTTSNGTSCLLPYSIVRSIVLKDNPFERMMQIGELHIKYGEESLRQNSKLTAEMSAANVENKQFNDELSSSPEILAKDARSKVSAKSEPKLKLLPKGITSEEFPSLPKGVKPHIDPMSGPLVPSQPKKTASKEWSNYDSEDDNVDDIISQFTETTISKRAKVAASHPPKPQESVPAEALNTEEMTHLFDDLVIAFSGYDDMMKKKRSNIPQIKMFEAIDFEMKIRRKNGADYRPKTQPELDGDISITKHLHKHHSIEDWNLWVNGKTVQCSKWCILNSRFFQPAGSRLTNVTIMRALMYYVGEVRHSTSLGKKNVDALMKNVRFNYDRLGKPLTYAQGMTESSKVYKSLLNPDFHPDVESNAGSHMSRIAKERAKPYPPIDDDLLTFVNVRMLSIVKKVLEGRSQSNYDVKGHGEASKMYAKVVTEYIRRNPNWITWNKFDNAKKFNQLEESTGIHFPDAQAREAFDIIRTTLKECSKVFEESRAIK